MCVIAGVMLSIGTLAIDRATDFELIPQWITGGPDAAPSILETIAASMVSLATLVLTITMVVVQLAMGQFSPRIVQTFLRDRPSQLAIGLFVATFAHAMLALREVSTGEEGRVPGVAIVVSYVLVLVSIAMLVLYVDHIGRSLRVSSLIELVGSDTRKLIDQRYPELLEPARDDPHLITARKSAVINSVDTDRLVDIATRARCVLQVLAPIGAFVPATAPLVRVDGAARLGREADQVDPDAVIDAFTFGLERTLDADAAYGFRMLVDVAERSLSDSPFLDPTTAVQAIDRLHDGLRQLSVRVIGDGRFTDVAGQARVTMPVMCWDDYVHLAFDEIRLAGSRSPQVSRRLIAAIDDLVRIAPEDRRAPLEEQRRLLADAITAAGLADADQAIARSPDVQGIGVSAGTSPDVTGDASPAS